MLFLGDDSVAAGFRLIGFEVFVDPTAVQVDEIFSELRRCRDKAFVIVDDAVMRSGAGNLKQIRDEGGRVVVVAVPGLADPPRLASEVADRLEAMYGRPSRLK